MDAESFRKICEYKQEINRLLMERPELRPLQEKIDDLMAGAGSQHNRCVLLTQMLKDKAVELGEALIPLKTALQNLAIGVVNEINKKTD